MQNKLELILRSSSITIETGSNVCHCIGYSKFRVSTCVKWKVICKASYRRCDVTKRKFCFLYCDLSLSIEIPRKIIIHWMSDWTNINVYKEIPALYRYSINAVIIDSNVDAAFMLSYLRAVVTSQNIYLVILEDTSVFSTASFIEAAQRAKFVARLHVSKELAIRFNTWYSCIVV